MKYCTNCLEDRYKDKFCWLCGQKNTIEPVIIPACECGYEYRGIDSFCIDCGKEIIK